jgi:hypothetical protein
MGGKNKVNLPSRIDSDGIEISERRGVICIGPCIYARVNDQPTAVADVN